MGQVLAATQLPQGRRVAIKVLRPEFGRDPLAVARFLRETRAISQLKGDHVCRVLDVGTSDGIPYMAMELLYGLTLARELSTRKQLSVDEACEIMLQTCDGIGEAHSLGIIHRDLKPANLFLAQADAARPRVKILDFGVSKALLGLGPGEKSLTEAHVMLGTPLYVSPEQLRNSKRVDARADVWSLGVVFYQLLTGKLPFEHRSLEKLFVKISTEDPRPLRNDCPHVPPRLEEIVLRCLDRDPDARFANAGELGLEIAGLTPYSGARFERLVSFARAPSWRPSRPADELGVPSEHTPRLTSSPPQPGSAAPPSELRMVIRDHGRTWLALLRRISAVHLSAAAATAAAGFGVAYAIGRDTAEPSSSSVPESGSASAASAAVERGHGDHIRLSLHAEPPSATFHLDGKRLPGNPYQSHFARDARDHELEVSAPGYAKLKRRIRFNHNLSLRFSLAGDAGRSTTTNQRQ